MTELVSKAHDILIIFRLEFLEFSLILINLTRFCIMVEQRYFKSCRNYYGDFNFELGRVQI